MKGHQCRALQKSSFFITFLGVFAVLAGKGKLKKMSRWTSSRCDCKGARKDIHQDIFELISATAALRKYSVEYSLRASRTPKITLRIIFFESALT